MTIRTRPQLKSFFVKNAIPTEGNFADLIDSQLSQSEDGVYRQTGEPLAVVAAPGPQKKVLRLLADPAAANPDWLVSLTPTQDPNTPASARPGLGLTNAAGVPRLFLDLATGNAGLGTNNPGSNRLQVEGAALVNGALTVTGATTVAALTAASLKVTGTLSFAGASISGNTTFEAITAASLKVTGATSLAAVTATSLSLTANLTAPAGVATSDICVGRDDFGKLPWPYESIQVKAGRNFRLAIGDKERLTIDSGGNATIGGGLTVNGAATVSGLITANGGLTVTGNLSVGALTANQITATGGVRAGDISVGHPDGANSNRQTSIKVPQDSVMRFYIGERQCLAISDNEYIIHFPNGYFRFGNAGELQKYNKTTNQVTTLYPAGW